MRKLQYTEETHRFVDYSEFESLVREVYGQDYEFGPDEELSNDSKTSYHAEKRELGEYENRKLGKFVTTGTYAFLASVLFTDLCNRGHIEPGKYIVELSW